MGNVGKEEVVLVGTTTGAMLVVVSAVVIGRIGVVVVFSSIGMVGIGRVTVAGRVMVMIDGAVRDISKFHFNREKQL